MTLLSESSRRIAVALAAATLSAGLAAVGAPATTGAADAAVCSSGTIEAESGDLTGFTTVADPAASGGAVIVQPEGAGSSWSPSTTHTATYCVSIPIAGMYRMLATTSSDSGTSDSFWLAIDGELTTGNGLWIVPPGQLVESIVGTVGDNPLDVYLPAGDHTVTVSLREDGTVLDAFRFVHQDQKCNTSLRAEAEGEALAGFVAAREKGASRNWYAWVPEGTGSHWSADRGVSVSACVVVKKSGTYQIELGGFAPDNNSDSFFVQVDDREPVLYQMSRKNAWHSALVHGPGTTVPSEFVLDAGEHTISIHLREDGAKLDFFELVRKPGFSGPCNAMSYEAERGDVVGFEIGSDNRASGRRYLHVPEGAGSAWIPSQGHKVSFCFDVPAAGDYQLQATVMSPSNNADSFWLSVNGSDPGLARWDTAPGMFVTDLVSLHGTNGPATVALDAGANYLDVFLREDGTGLDAVALVAAG